MIDMFYYLVPELEKNPTMYYFMLVKMTQWTTKKRKLLINYSN